MGKMNQNKDKGGEMKGNSFAEIAKWFGITLIGVMIVIFIFAKSYSWMIVPITATLAIITILFGYFISLKKK
jgi:hypothetical protein